MIEHHDQPASAALTVLSKLMLCCEGAAMYGPHRCTCWEPIFPLGQDAQQTPIPDAPITVGETPCADCAYRPDSPEKRGVDYVTQDAEQLEQLVVTGQLFWCHQGMRAPVAWRHPLGITVDVEPNVGYQPLTIIDPSTGHPVPYKLDGTPATVCAGWAARRLHHLGTMVSDVLADYHQGD